MPQLAVNMEVNALNKDCCKIENYRFKMRHAAYSNRYAAFPTSRKRD